MYSENYKENFLIKQKISNTLIMLLLSSAIVIHSINFSFSYIFISYLIMTFIWIFKYFKGTNQHDIQKKLEMQRNQWFADTLVEAGKENGLDSHLFNRQIQQITSDAKVYFIETELSIASLQKSIINTLPDIGIIEGEITDLERKIAKVFVLFVFSPFIFILLHYFFQFKLEYILLNLINSIIIIDNFASELRSSPNIQGWTEFKYRAVTLKNEILYSPKSAWNNFISNSNNITNNDLIDDLIIINDNWISKLEQLLFNICRNFDPYISFSLLDNFIDKTKGLEISEDIQNKKWNSFSMQFTFLAISVYFFTSILSSIFFLFYRILEDSAVFTPFIIENNYFEIEFLQLLLITIILINYSTIFHSKNKTVLIVIFCLTEYIIVRMLLFIFFIIII